MTEKHLEYLQCVWLALAPMLLLVHVIRQSPRRVLHLPKAVRHHVTALDLLMIVVFQLIVMSAAAVVYPPTLQPALGYYLAFFICQLLTAVLSLFIIHRRFENGIVAVVRLISRKTFKLTLLFFVIAIGFTWLTLGLTQWLCELWDISMPKHEFLQAIAEDAPAATKIFVFLSPALGAVVMEELLFRGLLQNFLTSFFANPVTALPVLSGQPRPPLLVRKGHQWMSILVTAAVFAVFHGHWQHWPALFVLALTLGYTYQKCRNLMVPILIHAGFNTMTLTLTLISQAAANG